MFLKVVDCHPPRRWGTKALAQADTGLCNPELQCLMQSDNH